MPEAVTLITLAMVGEKAESFSAALSEDMLKGEKNRPPRLDFKECVYLDSYRD